ncbi:MAG: hypothetical protein QW677_02045 [Pyrobaculum sp.]|uniref:hypothetical protein n=1 Tax=Pyrobaculum sp. TaxID=2004705 RepID=UPI00316739C2
MAHRDLLEILGLIAVVLIFFYPWPYIWLLIQVSEALCQLWEPVDYALSPKCGYAGVATEVNATGFVYGPCQYELQMSSCVVGRVTKLGNVVESVCMASDGRYAVFLAQVALDTRTCGFRPLMLLIEHILVVVDMRTGEATWTNFLLLNATTLEPYLASPSGAVASPWKNPAALSQFVVFGKDGVYLRNATGPYAIVISREFRTAKANIAAPTPTPPTPIENTTGAFIKIPAPGGK